MSFSRRGFFGALAAAGAAPLLGRIAVLMPAAPLPAGTYSGLMTSSMLSAELAAIARKSFIPAARIQIYQSHPLLKAFMTKRENAREEEDPEERS